MGCITQAHSVIVGSPVTKTGAYVIGTSRQGRANARGWCAWLGRHLIFAFFWRKKAVCPLPSDTNKFPRQAHVTGVLIVAQITMNRQSPPKAHTEAMPMCWKALSPSRVRSNKKSQSKTCTLPSLIGQKRGLLPRSLLTFELPPQQATMAPQATKKDEARWLSVTTSRHTESIRKWPHAFLGLCAHIRSYICESRT